MRLNFRQGIVKALTVSNQPSFLTYSSVNNAVSINITSVRLIITAAYVDENYLHEHRDGLTFAWGPFSWNPDWGTAPTNPTYYMYWDWNLGTGIVTLGYTGSAPSYGAQPPNPPVGKHWFDYDDNIMKMWDGSMWTPCIRVFAGYVNIDENLHTGSITHYPIGTQVGIEFPGLLGDYVEAGWVVHGMDNKAIRTSDGKLVTSVTNVNTNHGSFTSPIKLELLNSQATATEPIPAYYAITNDGDGGISLASNSDITKRPIGIVDRNLLPGESSEIIAYGVVYNDAWNWDPNLGKLIFCGADGLLFQGVPAEETTSVKIGSIIDSQSILVDIGNYRGGPTGPNGGPAGPTGPAGTGATGPTGATGTPLTSIPYDFLYTVFDSIIPLSIVGGSLIVKNLLLPVNLPGSLAHCENAPVIDSTFDILLNGISIGTIFFAANSTSGVFTFPGSTVMVPGDLLKIKAKDTPDFGSLANIYISIIATYII